MILACDYFAEIDRQIAELEQVLELALAGKDDDMEDPSELRAEIARLKRLAD